MSEDRNNVHELRGGVAPGGGNGDRMRSVEARLTRLETVVETTLPTLATKEDIQKIKVWILGGLLAGIVIVVPVVLTLFRIFLPVTAP